MCQPLSVRTFGRRRMDLNSPQVGPDIMMHRTDGAASRAAVVVALA